MNHCATCKGEDLRPVDHRVTFDVPVRDGIITLSVDDVPGLRCAGCHDVYTSAIDLSRAELLVATELADRGIRSAGAFEHMRKALSLRREDLVRLFDLSAETLSQWESGLAPVDRATWAAVAAMVSDRMAGTDTTLDRLRTSLSPREPRGPIVLHVRPVHP